jgi:hypothetical protein
VWELRYVSQSHRGSGPLTWNNLPEKGYNTVTRPMSDEIKQHVRDCYVAVQLLVLFLHNRLLKCFLGRIEGGTSGGWVNPVNPWSYPGQSPNYYELYPRFSHTSYCTFGIQNFLKSCPRCGNSEVLPHLHMEGCLPVILPMKWGKLAQSKGSKRSRLPIRI